MNNTKQCRGCHRVEELSQFRLLKGRYYTGLCRPCLRLQESENRDRGKKSEYRKDYYAKNKEAEKQKVKEWVGNNRQAKSSHVRRREASLMLLTPIVQRDWEEVLNEHGDKCLNCGSINVTVDHVVPLCKGGTNAKDNLQPLCAPCNSSKGTKTTDYRRNKCSK